MKIIIRCFLFLFAVATICWIIFPDVRRRFNDWAAEDSSSATAQKTAAAKVSEGGGMTLINMFRMSEFEPDRQLISYYLDSARQASAAAAAENYFKTHARPVQPLAGTLFRPLAGGIESDVVANAAAKSNLPGDKYDISPVIPPLVDPVVKPEPPVKPKPAPRVLSAEELAAKGQDVLDSRRLIFHSMKHR